MIVADTNLLVYLFLPGEHTEAAEQVLQRDPSWAAPLLWRSEFRNVLALYLRKELLTMEVAVDAFRRAEAGVRGREYATETTRILDLVQQSVCSAYDCEYVALAKELDVPLVTSDTQLRRVFPEIAVSMEDFVRSPQELIRYGEGEEP